MICGTSDFIARAHRIRKMAGGGMRQAGIMAAGALYALEHNITRLLQDHILATRLYTGIISLNNPSLVVLKPTTNMVFITLLGDAGKRVGELPAFMKEHNILVLARNPLRLATHLDMDEAGIDRVIAAMAEFFFTR